MCNLYFASAIEESLQRGIPETVAKMCVANDCTSS